VHVVGDARRLPVRDAAFDVVLCTEMLEHVPEPQQAIDEMWRVLKPGGTLVLTTRFLFPIHDAPHDYFRFTKYGLRHLLKRFEVLELQEEADSVGTIAILVQRLGMQARTLGSPTLRGDLAGNGPAAVAAVVPHHRGVRRQPEDPARTGNHDERVPRGLPEAWRMTTGEPRAGVPSRWTRVLTAVLVPLAALVVYWPAILAGFVGDDFMILHRLRALTGPADAARFFGAEFFEYYRPIGFLAHAVDYAAAGEDPRRFHLTNLLLHAASATLVLLIARRLSPHSLAGPIAALLFALHPSNHEAVVWISARFDLLATGFSLAAIWWMVRRDGSRVGPAVLFVLAVLSKESAVALPLAAAGWSVFVLRSSTRGTLVRVAPWIAALATAALLRQAGGGVSAVGGAARLPKLLAFAAVLGIIVLLADGRWTAWRERLRANRRSVALALAIALLLTAVLAAASSGAGGRFAAEKLAVAGFASFHLLSPVIEVSDTPFYLDPMTSRSQWAGLALAAVVAGIVLALWRRLLDDPRMWFLGAFLVATLLPISALTEGKRYLYLPSAAFSLAAGVLLAEVRRPHRPLALGAVGVVLAISSVEISAKIRDWRWAGEMTADGAALVDQTLAPACDAGHVVFLTSPVAISCLSGCFRRPPPLVVRASPHAADGHSDRGSRLAAWQNRPFGAALTMPAAVGVRRTPVVRLVSGGVGPATFAYSPPPPLDRLRTGFGALRVSRGSRSPRSEQPCAAGVESAPAAQAARASTRRSAVRVRPTRQTPTAASPTMGQPVTTAESHSDWAARIGSGVGAAVGCQSSGRVGSMTASSASRRRAHALERPVDLREVAVVDHDGEERGSHRHPEHAPRGPVQ
jgi:SAM-dependent methyltransferase